MGYYLGQGHLFADAKAKFMKEITVEGADLAKEMAEISGGEFLTQQDLQTFINTFDNEEPRASEVEIIEELWDKEFLFILVLLLQYAINALDLIHGFSVLLFAILNMLSLLSLTLFFDK